MTTPRSLALSNALAFAARGYAVLPVYGVRHGRCTCGKADCSSPGKHPFAPTAPRGLKDATTDRTRVKHFSQNYGVITDKLLVVDIDPRHGGDKAWKDLSRKPARAVPHTWEVNTGGGGKHIMLNNAAGIKCCKLARGVDIKGVDGYVVGPGSMHISGKLYAWAPQCTPNEVALADPPHWLLEEIAKIAAPAPISTPRTAEYYNDLVAPALPGERHAKVARLLGHVLSVPHPAILLALVISHVRLTYPDLSNFGDKEIEKIARDLLRLEDKKCEAA